LGATPRGAHELDVTEPDDNRPRLVVLESFGPPHGRNNPYFLLLFDAFPASIDARYFSWRFALTGSYDVFHLHWPEVMIDGRTRSRSVVRLWLFVLLLLRLRVQRKPLVRTLHNTAPHEAVSGIRARVIAWADRATTVWITLSDRIEPLTDAPTVVAVHGHFRDWFGDAPAAAPVAGRLVFVGRIRRYKGVDRLLAAFGALTDAGASLHVVGKTEDAALAADLRDAMAADARLTVLDDFVPDEVMARELLESELVVLPFVEMTNSSSMILALSLDRPVLVPRLPVTEELAAEVGSGWVLIYEGDLDAAALAAALTSVRGPDRAPRPDLSARDWPPIGERHAAAFALGAGLVAR
jgi:beta-1,4-mannosyltransferase